MAMTGKATREHFGSSFGGDGALRVAVGPRNENAAWWSKLAYPQWVIGACHAMSCLDWMVMVVGCQLLQEHTGTLAVAGEYSEMNGYVTVRNAGVVFEILGQDRCETDSAESLVMIRMVDAVIISPNTN